MPRTMTPRFLAAGTWLALLALAASCAAPPPPKDETAPEAPVLAGTAPVSPSADRKPRISGQAEAESRVRIFLATCTGTPLATLDAESFAAGTFVEATADATSTFVADATDAAGNVSACAAPVTYVHDGTAPAPAQLTGSTPVSPSNVDAPTIQGRAEAGATVALFIAPGCETAIGTATADSEGNFAMSVTVAHDADTRFSATVTDAVGNTTACRDTATTYRHDGTAPAAPVLDGTVPRSPAPTDRPTLEGRVAAGSQVRIFASTDCSGTPVATLDSAAETFSIELAATAEGSTTWSAEAVDAAGNASPCSADAVTFVSDAVAPEAPSITGISPASPANTATIVVDGTAEDGSLVALFEGGDCSGTQVGSGFAVGGAFTLSAPVQRNGSRTFSASATDEAGNTGPCSAPSTPFVEDSLPPEAPLAVVASPSQPSSGNVFRISGQAEPGAVVTLADDDDCLDVLASGVAGEDGRFSVEVRVADDLVVGLRARAADSAGNRSVCVRTGTTLVEDSTAPTRPTLTAVSSAAATSTNTGTVTGRAEALASVQLFTDEDCSARLGAPAIADAAGRFTAPFEVADDTITRFFATATDAAGNASGCSTTSVVFTEDSRAPAPPTVRNVTPSTPTSSNSGVLSGNAEPGARIAVFTDAACARPLGFTTTAGAGGDWVVGVILPDDTVATLTANATDAAGNTSACSTTGATFTEDSTPPALAVITGLTPVPPANENRPTIAGNAEAHSTVRLYATADCSGEALAVTTTGSNSAFSTRIAVADDTVTALKARATDAAGNTSACPPTAVSFEEDSRAPGAPVLVSTTPASPANAGATIDLAGTAEAASTVRIHTSPGCSGSSIAEVVTGAEGAFLASVAVVADTTNAYYATATDLAGNRSACSSTPLAFIEDSTAPAAPVLGQTTPASPSTSLTPTVTGTAEPGSTVKLHLAAQCAGTPVVTGIAAADGTFSLAVTVPQDATTTVTASATDASGNVSPCAAALTYVADNTAPARPAITGTLPTSPSASTTPAINGTAEANALVTLYTTVDCTGTARGTGVATGGAFSITVTPAVNANSTTTFYVNATDAVGNVSTCSAGRVFVSDGSAPSTPRITSSTPTSPSKTSTTPVFSGTADAGTTVRLYRSATCGGTLVTSTVAAAGGAFSLAGSVTANTSTAFTVTSVDAANNVSACSAPFTYVHDSVVPAAPSSLTSTPTSPSSTSSAPVLSGNAEAGATVRSYSGPGCVGAVLTTVVATAGGTFQTTLAATANATSAYSFQATDLAGNVSACSATFTYIHDALAPAAPSIASFSPTSPSNATLTPILTGTAEAGATVLIYGAANCTGAVAATGTATGGNFSIVTPAVANTSNSFSARARDAAGNLSPCSVTRTWVHDAIAPAAPVVTGVSPQSPSNSAGNTSFGGTAEPGAVVTGYLSSTCAGTAVVTTNATSGTFLVAVALPANATTSVTFRAVDAVGNVSACSTPITYTRDQQAPAAPVLAASTPASPVNTTSISITGTAEALATVTLYTVAGCTGTFAARGTAVGGAFSLPVTPATNATTTYYGTATDPAGNVSACTTTGLAIVHDSIAPAVPTITATTPDSPSGTTTSPTFAGGSEAGSTVGLYTTSNCSGTAVATTTTTAGGTYSLVAPVTANASTTLYALARDAAGNASPCSAGRTFVHDSVAPAAPAITGTTPVSPATSTTPVVAGTSEASATVKLYGTANCTGSVLGSGTATAGGAFSVASAVPANTSSSLRATATDAAGNVSACSAAFTYVSDATAPTFAGGFSATALSSSTIALTWTSATDAFTPQASIVYDICQSALPGSCQSAFVVTNTTAAGATTATIAGLVSDTRYYFVVRARDLAGNRDANMKVVAAKTMGSAAMKQVSGTSFHTCALSSTGEVFCWGLGTSGQIGDGLNTTQRFPVRVPGLTNVKSISVGYWHTLAVLDDGRVFGWGQNTEGQLGDSSLANHTTPYQIPGLSGAVSVAANANSSCVLLGIGRIQCFGDNTYGQLGDGSTTRRTSPVLLTVLQAVSLHAGARHFCAVVADKTVQCWGLNAAGQLGDGTQVNRATPTTIPQLGNVRTVAGGHSHGCAVLYDGTARCWGRNDLGQLGDGTTTGRTNHLPVSGITDAVAIATGYHQTCALLSTNGAVKCWGYNASGSVGDNSTTNRTTPVQVVGVTSAASIAVGDASCAVLANGVVRCWGENASNQLGNGTTTSALVPVTPVGLVDVSAGKLIAATQRTTCAVSADGNVKCWGLGTSGQLGNGGNATSVVPVDVSGLTGVVAITAGFEHFCALRATGTVACWGKNNLGQLGDGTQTDAYSPVTVVGLAGAKAITAGNDHSCAVVADGTLRCWGNNGAGQFGNGTQSAPTAALPVTAAFSGVTNIALLAAGAGFTCLTTGNGTPRCAGLSTSGQLGSGISTGSVTPVSPVLSNITSLSARIGTVCAGLSDGTVRCWGANSFGQLGDGTKNNATAPVTMPGATNVVSVHVGNQAVCVLRSDGGVSCVGGNQAGQLGNGTTTESLSLAAVPGLTEVIALASGGFHEVVLRSDGTLTGWAANDNGQLGDLTVVQRNTPVNSIAYP